MCLSRQNIDDIVFSIRIFVILNLVIYWNCIRIACAHHVHNNKEISQGNSTWSNYGFYDNDILSNANSDLQPKLSRGKRYLDFTKGARMSWRVGVKNNILNVNTLWGYGYGFRSNFPFPNKEDRLKPFSKRDLLHAIGMSLDWHGLDGRACLLRAYCTAVLDPPEDLSGGMLFKLLQLFFNQITDEGKTLPYLNTDNCWQLLHTHCPLSFNSIFPFTDDV